MRHYLNGYIWVISKSLYQFIKGYHRFRSKVPFIEVIQKFGRSIGLSMAVSNIVTIKSRLLSWPFGCFFLFQYQKPSLGCEKDIINIGFQLKFKIASVTRFCLKIRTVACNQLDNQPVIGVPVFSSFTSPVTLNSKVAIRKNRDHHSLSLSW